MPILKPVESPFGAGLNFHVIQRVEGSMLDAHQVLVLTVASWPTEASYVQHNGTGATYNWYVPIPMATITNGQDFTSVLENALVSETNSPMYQGSVVPGMGDLAAARDRQWARLKQTREVLDNETITVGGITFDGDAASKTKIMGAIMDSQLTNATSRNWVDANNVQHEITTQELINLGTALAARTQSLVETSNALRTQVYDPAKTTVQEVEAVVWPTAPTVA